MSLGLSHQYTTSGLGTVRAVPFAEEKESNITQNTAGACRGAAMVALLMGTTTTVLV